MDDEQYMSQALAEARKAYAGDEVPVGAIIVLNNQVIARGFNQVETLTDSTAHAEIITLTAAFNFLGNKYLPDARIYITVEPCLMCAGALYWSKIGAIVYGTDDPKNGYKRFFTAGDGQRFVTPFHPKTTLKTGILHEECSLLMKDFFRSKR